MRIVVVNDGGEVRGGATKLATLFAQLSHAAGFDTTFFSGSNVPLGLEKFPTSKIVSAELPSAPHTTVASFSKRLWNREVKKCLSAWIAANDTPGTIYHVHSWSRFLSPSVFSALRSVRDRLVITAHDLFLVCPNGGYFDYRKNLMCTLKPGGAACLATHCDKRTFGHKLWRDARHLALKSALGFDNTSAPPCILTIHPRVNAYLEAGGIPSASIQTLRNPTMPLLPHRVKAEANTEFLFIGRLVEEKGIRILIDAATAAGVPLRVLGDGPLLNELSALHPDVIFEGWCDRATIASRISSARCLVMPSLYPEPFGLVAVESLACGIPIVISETAFLCHEVTAAGAGILCSPTDPQSLGEIIGKISADDGMVRTMSEAAYSHAPSMAETEESWLRKTIGVYQSILSGLSHNPLRPNPVETKP